jgi:hypothetical protein
MCLKGQKVIVEEHQEARSSLPPFDPRHYEAALKELGAAVLAGLISFLVFARTASRAGMSGFYSDFISHFELHASLLQETWWVYSFWYRLQDAVLFGAPTNDSTDLQSGLLVLGGLGFLKGVVLYAVFRAFRANKSVSIVLSFLAGSAMAFPTLGLSEHFYLGTLPPNVFHTATQLLSNTCAVLAIASLTAYFVAPSRNAWAVLLISGAVSSLAKPALTPSWLVALAVVGAVTICRSNGPTARRRVLLSCLSAGLFPLLTLILTMFGTFSGESSRDTRLSIRVFEVWSNYSSNIVWDFLRSLAFPLAVLTTVLIGRTLRRDWRLLLPSWTASLAAFAVFSLMAEINPDGSANLDGNLGWGAIAANSALYVMSAVALQRRHFKNQLTAWIVLLVQVIATLMHLHQWLTSGSYV